MADFSSVRDNPEVSPLQEFSDAEYHVSCDLLIFCSSSSQEVFSLQKFLDVD